jgi:Na+-transporting methylmalonyl-CoA/oxaloacetate decarboxylase gamma subunit
MKFLAVMTLLATAATLPIVGGVAFAFLFVGAFLLALVGVLAGLENRTVAQHNPSMNPRRWRDGS